MKPEPGFPTPSPGFSKGPNYATDFTSKLPPALAWPLGLPPLKFSETSEHGKIRITPSWSAVSCCDKHYLQKQGGELISAYGLRTISGSLDGNLRPEAEAESTEERCCSSSAHLASLYSPGPPAHMGR